MEPSQIGRVLSLQPTGSLVRDTSSPYRPRRETNLWEWCTREIVHGVDSEEHLKAIIDFISPSSESLSELQKLGCETDIFFYWVSSGQGGPFLQVETMRNLVNLNLPIYWDMYFGKLEDYQKDRT